MSYALLSDDMLLQLEHANVSRDARLLHLEAMVHSATALTDGVLTVRLGRFSDATDPEALALELVAAGLWEELGAGFRIVGYLDHQRSKEEIELTKRASRERQERHRRHKLGDHSQCSRGRYCPQGHIEPVTRDTTRDTTRQATRDTTPTNPIQSNPSKDWMEGATGRSPAAPSTPHQPAALAHLAHLCEDCGAAAAHPHTRDCTRTRELVAS